MVEGAAGRKRLIGVAEDITDRKGAEVALRQSEERFRQMAESMPQVVWTAMPDGTCDYVNARWTDLTGCDLAATQAGAFRRNMLPEDLDSMDLAAIAGLRAGEPCAFECRFQRISDGTLRWHLVRAVPVRNADGEVTKWLGTSTDIDDRKQAAEALQLSDWRLRFTLDAANFGSWELNLQTQHAHRSPRHDAIFGYESPLPDWTYAQFLEHVIPVDREEVNRRFQNSFNGGGDWNFECRIKRASDRTTRWIWGYGKTILNDEGTPTLMLGLISDITARKEAESALAQANEDLKRANADLEQFAYSASHDLQEPLRSVIIYGQLLSRRYKEKLDGQALEFLSYLTGGASRMEMLVRDLLAYTQVKHLEAPEIQCDATQSLNAALSNLTNAIVESEARITAGPFPVLSVHNIHLQQLFQNLIGNDLKYRSKIQPSIEVGAERQNEHWLFSVRDNGIGIDPQYKERIFGLFKRLHAGDEYSGTGIGLAICKRIVDRYHGRIWWNPSQGKDRPSTSPSPSEESDPRKHHQILLVEDNKADAFLFREALEMAGVQADLHVLPDGEKAIDFIDQADADESAPCPVFVLLDLNLPKKSGLEVLQHLRESRRCREARVLVVTSSDSEKDRTETAKLGANGYFRKPSNYDAFMKIGEFVRELLPAISD